MNRLMIKDVARHSTRSLKTDHPLPLAPDLDPACAPLVAVHRCYGAINALAVRRGRDPDAPPHLNKVTETI